MCLGKTQYSLLGDSWRNRVVGFKRLWACGLRMGDREHIYSMRWLDPTKRSSSVRVPVGGRWGGEDEGAIDEGREAVRGGGEICGLKEECMYLDRGKAGTGPLRERGACQQGAAVHCHS